MSQSVPLVTNRGPKRENPWTLKEDIIMLAMRREDPKYPWKEILEKLPNRTRKSASERYRLARGLSREWSEEQEKAFSTWYTIEGRRDQIWGKCAAELDMSAAEVEEEHAKLCGQWKAGEDYTGRVLEAYERNWREMWEPIALEMDVPVEACDVFWTCVQSQGLKSWNDIYQEYLIKEGMKSQ